MSAHETEFFRSSPDPCCILDAGDRFVRANPSLERVLGHPDSRLVGKLLWELAHPDDQLQVRAALKRAGAPGESARLEARWIMRNGDYRWLAWHLARGSDGVVFCSGFDVSQQKRSQEESVAWQRRFEMAVGTTEDAYWDWNLVSGEVQVSPAWGRILGLDPRAARLQAEELKRQLRSDDLPGFERCFQEAMESRRQLRVECRVPAKSGGVRWVRISGQVSRDDAGRPLLLSCWVRDVTELKEERDLIVEQQIKLVASAKLAQLGRVAAGVAHEINNPTSIVYGYASQLKVLLERGGTPPERFIQIATKIENVSVRIAKIIKGLRNFARDGEQDPFVCTHLVDILEESLELCKEQMRTSGVDLIVDPGADRELGCECRTVQISQVLVNLMQNANDAISGLPSPWIRISLADLGDRVSILIRDSGPGIPQEVRKKLMEPFFTTKPKGRGTGLGLSISKNIIESHGGRFYLRDSDPNTCFVIELPKTQARRKSDEGKKRPSLGPSLPKA